MSADDRKRPRPGRDPRRAPAAEPPRDGEAARGEAPAEGAFFRAATKAFQALPTEVLDVGSGSGQGRSEAKTRATRLPPSQPEAESDFLAPPPTEAIDTASVRRDAERRAEEQHPRFTESATEHIDMTNPEPFRVDSVERALFEVAREPTHHDLILDELEAPVSETSTDADVPAPVSGVEDPHVAVHAADFEDNTVALEAMQAPPGRAAPALDLTDPDGFPVSAPSAADAPLPAAALPEPPGDTADQYYEELRGVIGAARVFDPKRAVEVVTDPGYRDRSFDEWPELTLDPAPAAPSRGVRSTKGLVLFLLATLVVTVGGVGIGFALSQRGVSLDDVLESARVEAPPDDPAPAAPEVLATAPSLDDAEPAVATSEPSAPLEAAPVVIDPEGTWRGRTVQIYLANLDDASRSGLKGLDDTLLQAFTSALAADEHARWKVVPTRPRRGWGFHVSLAVVDLEQGDAGVATVRCALHAAARHKPRGVVKADASGERRGEGSLAGADDAKLAREASRACGFALALRFFESALR